MAKVLVLHGPNLNLLGTREPHHYGHETLDSINRALTQKAAAHHIELLAFQSQSEAKLIHAIHEAYQAHTKYIIFNPAAFTHTSIALRDALLATSIPFIEVHLSNIHAREPFRHTSYFSDIAHGTITGFGAQGYLLALDVAIKHIEHIEQMDAQPTHST